MSQVLSQLIPRLGHYPILKLLKTESHNTENPYIILLWMRLNIWENGLAQKLLFASTFVGASACTQAVVQGHAPFLCHNTCSNFCLNFTEMFLFHLLQLLHHLLWLSSATLIHLQIQLITPLHAITEINVFPCCILSSQQCVGYFKLCWLDAFDWKFATGINQCCAVISIFEEPSVSVFLIFQN